MSLLECNGLTKFFGNTIALDTFDLNLEEGKIVGLLGPNGSGKTTLIKLCNRLLQPSSGELLIDGKVPSTETKKMISYLPDRECLPNWMKIHELVNFYKDFFEDFDQDKALKLLRDLDIPQDMSLKKMSKGTKEKVQLVLTMSRNAKIYLLDEPLSGVDPAARDYILKTIIQNYSENSLVIISTHLIADVESILDEAVFIKDGKLLLHKPVDQIREETNKSVDEYFREVFSC